MSQLLEREDLPCRIVKGRWIRRDYYRWFIETYDHGVIWFYRSDVRGGQASAEKKPIRVLGSDKVEPMVPTETWVQVELYVVPDAREHPQGTDW